MCEGTFPDVAAQITSEVSRFGFCHTAESIVRNIFLRVNSIKTSGFQFQGINTLSREL